MPIRVEQPTRVARTVIILVLSRIRPMNGMAMIPAIGKKMSKRAFRCFASCGEERRYSYCMLMVAMK